MPGSHGYVQVTHVRTLFEEILFLARQAGVVREGTATGGTTTSLEDTTHKYTSGEFPGGTIFFLSGASLQHTRMITGYTGKTFSFSPATDQAIDPEDPETPIDQPILAGIRYAVADKDFPRDLLVQAVNSALRLQYPLIIEYPQDNDSINNLVTVAGQEDYTVGTDKIYRVEIAGSKTDPYGFVKNFHWEQIGNLLHFSKGFAPASSGYLLRLLCELPFIDLVNDLDEIAHDVDLKILHWQAVVELCRVGLKLYGADDKRQLTNLLNEAYGQLQRLPIPKKIQRDPHLAEW